MKNKNKEIVFSNGDPIKPVFCLDGKKYYTDKDVERLIEEYEDRLRVARGNLNLVETLNSFMDRDLKNTRRALLLARAERADTITETCLGVFDSLGLAIRFRKFLVEEKKYGDTPTGVSASSAIYIRPKEYK